MLHIRNFCIIAISEVQNSRLYLCSFLFVNVEINLTLPTYEIHIRHQI
jgi:hypothetical protein